MDLTQLPEDTLKLIFNYLKELEICRTSQCAKTLFAFADKVWSVKLLSHHGITCYSGLTSFQSYGWCNKIYPMYLVASLTVSHETGVAINQQTQKLICDAFKTVGPEKGSDGAFEMIKQSPLLMETYASFKRAFASADHIDRL